MRFFGPGLILIGLTGFVAVGSASVQEVCPAEVASGKPWEECLSQLHQAAKLAHEGRVAEAEAVLERAGQQLPSPYAILSHMMRSAVVSQFSDISETMNYRFCAARAATMLQLGEPSLALHWAQQAAQLGDERPSIDRTHMAWKLAAVGRHAEAIAEYEKAIKLWQKASSSATIEQEITERMEAIRAVSRDDSLATRLRFIRVHYLGWNERGGYSGRGQRDLLALEQLATIFELTQEEADRRIIYDAMKICFKGIGDRESLARWEAKMLAEPWATPEDAAIKIAERAQQAWYSKDFAAAERQWRQIVEQYPQTKQFGIAQFNLGRALQVQRKYDAAIAEYEKLFPSRVNDREPGASVMETFRNYRHSAAFQISRCYEGKGDLSRALEWANEARDKYRFQSWCGTCSAQAAASVREHIVRLLRLARRTDEALKLVEEDVFGESNWSGAPLWFGVFLAEEYHARGQSRELRERLEERLRKSSLPARAKSESRDSAPPDGCDPTIFVAAEILKLFDVAKQGKIEELWRRIQKSDASAMLSLIPDPKQTCQEAIAAVAARELLTHPKAPAYLRRKLSGLQNERAWAAVLLVRMGQLTDGEAIRDLAFGVRNNFTTEKYRDAAFRAQQDLCYALLLLDPNPKSELYGTLAKTQLESAARTAREYVKQANESEFDLSD